MNYALNLAPDGRILSACKILSGQNYNNMILVESIPANVSDYKYINDIFVYSPVEVEEVIVPNAFDILEAQVIYTAMMTDTLLEVE